MLGSGYSQMAKHESQPLADLRTLRKRPVQERARRMAADLLEGATRVLEDVGAQGFTTNRVAEATGASIGSLYQYYPNKAALLAALHQREASRLWEELSALLADVTLPARTRFCSAVKRTIVVQAEAHELQAALRKENIEVPDTPGFADIQTMAAEGLLKFLRSEDERNPQQERPSLEARTAQVEYVLWVIFSILQRIADEPPAPKIATRLAEDTGRMLADFVGLTPE